MKTRISFSIVIAPMRRTLPLLIAIALLAGCGSGADAPVVATTTQAADLARNVAGDRIKVAGILTPNADPHGYEPRARDVKRLVGAKLVLHSGGEVDEWLEEAQASAGSDARVVTLGENTREEPHWWQDPRAAIAAVANIRDGLSEVDPDNRAAYDANARRYTARLRALDRGIARCVGAVPPARRKLVTDHDAFGYFARRYGVQVIGAVIPSQTTQAQPSAGDIAKLSALIQRERVKAVFPETSINQKLAQALARQTGATAHYDLYGDTLGPAGSPGASYLGMERANANAMVRGFTGGRQGCTIPGL